MVHQGGVLHLGRLLPHLGCNGGMVGVETWRIARIGEVRELDRLS